jgi:PfaD family protein
LRGGQCADPESLDGLTDLLLGCHEPVCVVEREKRLTLALGGDLAISPMTGREVPADALPVFAWSPASGPDRLGEPSFCRDHGLDLPLMCGAMAHGIASTEMVVTLSHAGMLGSYGAAGQSLGVIGEAIDFMAVNRGRAPFCVNLIHSPSEPEHEEAVVDLLLERGVTLVEASAYMTLTPAVVRYRVKGLRRGEDGRLEAPNRIIAKASRLEVAERWFRPPPSKIVAHLLEGGKITAGEAELAAEIPMAGDLTAEADSGGHTDNRPSFTLMPGMIALRDRLQEQFAYPDPLRVGLGGGIAGPVAAAAAFAMGAAYLVTGSVNQACVESGTSEAVRKILADASQADITMAPAADMFEMGVKVQVIKRGTMFPMRAAKLYELYRAHRSLDEIPPAEREKLEKTIFRAPLDEVWQRTRAFFLEREPKQARRGDDDPRHRMALVFRWYLGLSSHWANRGEADRRMDYQIWAGPAMGAFNEWTKGTFLEEPGNRRVVNVNHNIIFGAARQGRLNSLASQGIILSAALRRINPLGETEMQEYFN